jgi:hypothetical protein
MWHVSLVPDALEIPLRGPQGEPVDFLRTIASHGVTGLPPNRVDLEGHSLETTLAVPGGARTLRVTTADGKLRVETVKGSFHEHLVQTVAHMFRLDEDLSAFYAIVDDELAWCASGAGRMLRAPTVFEDVVKTNSTPIRKRHVRRDRQSQAGTWICGRAARSHAGSA